MRWAGQWNAAMDLATMSRDPETGELSEAVAKEADEQVLEAVNGAIVSAVAMEKALEDEGPVHNGDRCLMGAAISLASLQLTPDTTKQAERFFEAVLRYYPGTQSADDAQDGLDTCFKSPFRCHPVDG